MVETPESIIDRLNKGYPTNVQKLLKSPMSKEEQASFIKELREWVEEERTKLPIFVSEEVYSDSMLAFPLCVEASKLKDKKESLDDNNNKS